MCKLKIVINVENYKEWKDTIIGFIFQTRDKIDYNNYNDILILFSY
jgi:hypothetical protein